ELTPNRSVLSKIDNQYLDALTATVRRNFPAAVTTYSEIVQADPTKAEAHVDLGRAYEKNNQTDKAIESYAEAIKRDHILPLHFSGWGFFMVGNAISMLRTAPSTKPKKIINRSA